jgi:hypothetical protein
LLLTFFAAAFCLAAAHFAAGVACAVACEAKQLVRTVTIRAPRTGRIVSSEPTLDREPSLFY